MNAQTKKVCEAVCWLGVFVGVSLIIYNWLRPSPQQSGTLVPSVPLERSIYMPGDIEIGNSKMAFLDFRTKKVPGLPLLTPAQNQGITFEFIAKAGRVWLTTKVLDREGKWLVKIKNNHWQVPSKPQITDWNYDSDSLEVIGSTGRVVLQVRLLTDRLQLQGEFWNESGVGYRLVATGDSGHLVKLTQYDDPFIPSILPIFKYPNTQFLGKLGDPSRVLVFVYPTVIFVAVLIYATLILLCPLAIAVLWISGIPAFVGDVYGT